MTILAFTCLFFCAAFFLLSLYSAVISFVEKERRAAFRFIVTAIAISTFYGSVYAIGSPIVSAIAVALPVLFLLALAIPYKRFDYSFTPPARQIDERDIMFSRNELQPNTARYREYYDRKPELEELDNRFRSYSGLLSPKATYYHPHLFNTTIANFTTIESLHKNICSNDASTPQYIDPNEVTAYLRWWAKRLGVHSIGFTHLEKHHLYSHKGRREEYGQEIKSSHQYAVAFTVEMDFLMTRHAPQAPIIAESSQQYLNAAVIATQMAEFIRTMGFSARTHIDGNYQVVCPLVARDAGLGEIGRMGLLMTPKLGPRVRIAAITTDMPIIPEAAKTDASLIHFCTICKKCARACPSQSIQHCDRTEIEGVRRWQISSEKCFTYWCRIGTDCGRCMSVCPHSHPNNLLHNVVRWGIRRSHLFRYVALFMDDFYYGKMPASLSIFSKQKR